MSWNAFYHIFERKSEDGSLHPVLASGYTGRRCGAPTMCFKRWLARILAGNHALAQLFVGLLSCCCVHSLKCMPVHQYKTPPDMTLPRHPPMLTAFRV